VFLVVGLGSSIVLPAEPVAAAGVPGQRVGINGATCNEPADPLISPQDTPWAQRRLSPSRVWPLTKGEGVTVAVIDTGVDPSHPQLVGKVLPGIDLLTNTPRGNFDCDGHGTEVASLIVARCNIPNVGFCGAAPDATILPIRVLERSGDKADETDVLAVDRIAKGVDIAVASGVRVINISLVVGADSPVLRQAIKRAVNRGVLIVAAAGNGHDSRRPSGDAPVYPAAYPGVMGVGAIEETGLRTNESRVGGWVDLMAPGGLVLTATPQRGYVFASGTSFAAPFVSATAALVLAANPGMTGIDAGRRMIATTSNGRGTGRDDSYGRGEVDPYRAVTQNLVNEAPVPIVVPSPSVDPAAVSWADRWRLLDGAAGRVVGVGVLLLLLAVAVAIALARGGRRGWRAGRPAEVTEPPAHDDMVIGLFEVPSVLDTRSRPLIEDSTTGGSRRRTSASP
jgi:type VII secretion-associated serine protease mycosin